MNITVVMGTFNDVGGKPSGYARKVWESAVSCSEGLGADNTINYYNGGNYDTLREAFSKAKDSQVVIWWANVPNDAPIEKLVKDIKQVNPRAILVISKNNLEGKYNWIDLIGQLLAAHAALGLVVENGTGKFVATVLDPLGNAYAFREPSTELVGVALGKRIRKLLTFTRVRSMRIGPSRPIEHNPDTADFCNIIRAHAERFHDLVHAANSTRFVGNAAYRCTKGGFPAFREDGRVFVSRRNIDKRDILPDGFVEIDTTISDRLKYYGDNPPSVDAPIQRELFRLFPTVNYMIHAHVYLDTPLITSTRVPCGALEETEEIMAFKTDLDLALSSNGIAMVNLLGHGCLVLATDYRKLANLNWVGRALPEL